MSVIFFKIPENSELPEETNKKRKQTKLKQTKNQTNEKKEKSESWRT